MEKRMGWEIDKTIDFAYGHRVWTQSLNGEYADDLKCVCRHLHGHEGKVQIFLSGDGLDNTHMITDFRHLEWLKKWINAHVDHKFILDINDPLYGKIIGDHIEFQLDPVLVPGTDMIAGYQVNSECYANLSEPEKEYYEGFLIVDFVPTSERLSQWLAEIVQEKMKPLGVWVTKIKWWETPRSCSTYVMDWIK